ncbi:MAG: hypothetical protein R6U15_01740 [Candidatus Izemoplasmatales bacterium]
MKNLRVAVIPTETGNGINQSSTVEEILNCDEVRLYPLTDYFKAQNDEEIDLLHWSFLIDIEKKEDLTGTNIDGIHVHIKESKIAKIREIISNWGETSSCELELDGSPCLTSTGSNKNNFSQLIERFNFDDVTVISYHNELELNSFDIPYEDLREDLIDEIHEIMLDYDVDMDKTMERTKN